MSKETDPATRSNGTVGPCKVLIIQRAAGIAMDKNSIRQISGLRSGQSPALRLKPKSGCLETQEMEERAKNGL